MLSPCRFQSWKAYKVGTLVFTLTAGIMHGVPSSMMPKVPKYDIGTALVGYKNSIPKTTLKSSRGATVKLVVPFYPPICSSTPFAMPWIGFAAELKALMRLMPLSVFSPKRLYPRIFSCADPIFLCRPNTTKALCPPLPHCVAIDSVLSGKKLIRGTYCSVV